jgi:hypothetical protein
MKNKKKTGHRSPRSKQRPIIDSRAVEPELPIVPTDKSLEKSVDRKKWRARLFLEAKHIPLWSVVVTAVGVLIAIVALIVAYVVPWRIQDVNEARETSKIEYAFFIKPAPVPGEQFETTNRWELSIMIANGGPKTAQSFILNLHTPDPQFFLHSAPEVMSSPAAAEVQINKRIPDGIYQIVLKNFVPGDTCFLNMFYSTPDDKQQEFHEKWHQGGLFDESFGKRFVNQFWFTGEKLKIENIGALELKPSFEPL